MAKAEEIAILTVNGADYQDWETIEVTRSEYHHPFYHFRFTCSEGMPLAKNWAAMRIIPGMECSVTLAGELAITGLVCSRQVYVGKARHRVEIQGASNTIALAAASVVTQTGEFTDITYRQYANALVKNFPGMAFVEQGNLAGQHPLMNVGPSFNRVTQPAQGVCSAARGWSMLGVSINCFVAHTLTVLVRADRFLVGPIPRISNPPGTSVLDALEKPLRALGGIPLTSDVHGNLVAAVGPTGATDTIYEGDLGWPSYLIGREIIYNPGMAGDIVTVAQRPGSNTQWGAKVASMPYYGNVFQSLAASYAPQVVPLEVPGWQTSFLESRTNADRDWQNEDEITVFATVSGWLRPSGGLWKQSEMVSVVSPMLVMDGTVPLKVRSVVFSQDNSSGTTTTLELCSNAALKGFIPQGS